MIKSFKNAKTRKVHGTGKPKGFKGLDGKWAVEVFDMLETNNSLDDLPRLASYGLHALERQSQRPVGHDHHRALASLFHFQRRRLGKC